MKQSLERFVFFLSIGGVLFAGYLSGVKFFSETCAFNESCPYFLGYPACYFGLAMYLVIAVFAALRVFGKYDAAKANAVILSVSGLGILFAGYFTVLELPTLFSEGLAAYMLGLPTCAMGLVVYSVIFALSLRLRTQ